MTNTAVTGATVDIDGGEQLVEPDAVGDRRHGLAMCRRQSSGSSAFNSV
jgi:hypothetical protein